MNVKSLGYTVFFEGNDFSHLNLFIREQNFSGIFILCDKSTQKHCLPVFIRRNKALQHAKVIVIPAGEKHKTIDSAKSIWEVLLQNKADKNSLLISLGGGVICDMGGFIASTFKRGISFINIPTTLLAMADASVGGKNGVDFMGYKNIIGTITQPKGVFIYEGFLHTLPKRQLKNGFAEIIKAVLIGNSTLWKKLVSLSQLPQENFTSFIYDSVSVKNKIVLKDPYEKNIRKSLNFGHTVGHAIEAYYLQTKKKWLHGEAIAIGMCVELLLGNILQLTDNKTVEQAISFLKKHYSIPRFTQDEVSTFIDFMQHDKKNKDGKLAFALIKSVGKPIIDVYATQSQVKEAFNLFSAKNIK